MAHSRFLLRRFALLALAGACGRDVTPRPPDSAQPLPAVAAATAPAPTAGSGWLPALGPMLLLSTDTTSEAIALTPEDATIDTARAGAAQLVGQNVSLLDRSGVVGSARVKSLEPIDPEDECPGRPILHLDGVTGTRRWTVGFTGASVSSIPLDSLGGISRRDSAARAAEIARVASTFPSKDPSFAGLPFDVVDARGFMSGDRRVVAAIVARRVNREANPLEERTLVVTELDATGKSLANWYERSSGPEDDVEGNEILAAFTISGAGPYLLIARETHDGLFWSIIERTQPGAWRLRWTGGGGTC